ncbi:hypothetical protein HFO58_10950 [Rhizobium leguminosarum]|uniref:hypothetical protein n=1 Tax=Rhizobium leguminosarum TaxID=384 RepID=UPI001C97044B|nr:hypothetical protein [Rhizobium leguminosarum]MBY5533675.1 hypothetical protein [Rhizobium leguminosarum]
MTKYFSLVVAASTVLLAGCAISPVQEDVTHVSTPLVVSRIRCETRDAIRGQIAAFLLLQTKDKVAIAKGNELKDRSIPYSNIDLRPLRNDLKDTIAGFAKYAVTYDFTFTGTITNNLSGTLTPTTTFGAGSRIFPFTARLDRSRQNIQSSRETDTFGDLLKNTSVDYCPDPHANASRNYVYPITGSIGIAKQLRDFLSLKVFSNLGGPPTFTSNITFTTTTHGNLDPTIVISPVENSTTRSGGYGLTSERTDEHKVIIAFAAVASDMSSAEVAQFLTPGNIFQTPRGTQEEVASQKAAAESIVRFELGRQSGPVIINESFLSLF